jgi:Zn-dependent peptidase ImmA (M78 family)
MKSRLIFLIFLSLIISPLKVQGQSNQLDSTIYSKNLNVSYGMVPTYYSAGCENRAKEMQSLLSDIIKIYSLNNMEEFKFKLAVIDSSTWIGMPSQYRLQYGLFSVRQNWIIIAGDINTQNFYKIYGFEDFKQAINHNLNVASKTLEDAITAMYKFRVTHELGHLYITNVLKTLPPDRWTNELTANYFAFDFLFKKDQESLKTLKIVTQALANGYKPRYRSISVFNRKYSNVGVNNYAWYQSIQQYLVEEIYLKYKTNFLDLFARTFPLTNDQKKLSQKEIRRILDDLTEGVYSKWIEKMENKSEL